MGTLLITLLFSAFKYWYVTLSFIAIAWGLNWLINKTDPRNH